MVIFYSNCLFLLLLMICCDLYIDALQRHTHSHCSNINKLAYRQKTGQQNIDHIHTDRNSNIKRIKQTSLFFTPPLDDIADTALTASSSTSKIEKIPAIQDAALNILLENMPIAEKYSLLLQSYANNILDNTNRTMESLNTMQYLFTEMLSKSILPSTR